MEGRGCWEDTNHGANYPSKSKPYPVSTYNHNNLGSGSGEARQRPQIISWALGRLSGGQLICLSPPDTAQTERRHCLSRARAGGATFVYASFSTGRETSGFGLGQGPGLSLIVLPAYWSLQAQTALMKEHGISGQTDINGTCGQHGIRRETSLGLGGAS